jgi:hypothetical protein
MIECSIINSFYTPCSLTCWSLEWHPSEGTNMFRCMPCPLDEQERTPWLQLSLVFHQDGMPPTMICDGSKEQTLRSFRRKLHKAAQKSKPSDLSAASCTKQTVIPIRPNCIPHGRWQLRAASANWNGEYHKRWSRPDPPSHSRTTASTWKHFYASRLAMTFIWSTVKCLRP